MIKNKLKYDLTNDSNRKTLSNLKILNVMPDVYSVIFDCRKATNLSSLNLFEGLQKIGLSYSYNIQSLKIPSSVTEANIQNCKFVNLTFEESITQLKLTYKNNQVTSKFTILRVLTNDSIVSTSNDSTIAKQSPCVLECDIRFLNYLSGNNGLGNTYNFQLMTTLILRFLVIDSTLSISSITPTLNFNKILVIGPLDINGITNLYADHWYA